MIVINLFKKKSLKSFVFTLLFLSLSIWLYGQTYEDYFGKGYDLIYQNKYQEALDTLGKALTLKPDDPSALYQSARALAQLGKTVEAFENLNIAINEKVVPYNYLLQDTFLIPLRPHPNWNDLLAKYERMESGENAALYRELMGMFEMDQKYRQQIVALSKRGGWESSKIKELEQTMNKQDSLNLIRLETIIVEHGYPGKKLVGNAGHVAFYVIQHADQATQKRYLPVLQKAAEAGELAKGDLAMLIDRIRVGDGKAQVYGTQYRRNEVTGEFEFFPIEDIENVNTRRAEAGLKPIEEYAKRNSIKWQ